MKSNMRKNQYHSRTKFEKNHYLFLIFPHLYMSQEKLKYLLGSIKSIKYQNKIRI